ncbi:MAG: uroporphyrinogen decarboxylase [Candidatus Micrarchaeota archaeon]|nr:uroporphyrinogen decarboxylase [Candidatus Micrarchaeota archaeon]
MMPKNDLFIRACRGEKTPMTPIWLMRQAGRCLPDYRKIRQKKSLVTICKDPELASEVTLLPVDMLGVDAAICFSDIMLPLEAMGVGFELKDSIGPVIRKAIKNIGDVKRLKSIDPKSDMDFVMDTVRITKKRSSVPIIGLAGAPFTMASYMIEGSYNKNFTKTKSMMYNDPKGWELLMKKLTEMTIAYLKEQIRSGADAVQLFDSWVGCLGPSDYQDFVLPYTKKIFAGIKGSSPTIHFTTGTSSFLELVKSAGSDVVSVDWRIGLDEARSRIGQTTPIQGNLDPGILLGTKATIRSSSLKIIEQAGARGGHIFNLGHGILPGTELEKVKWLVDTVHQSTR